MHASTKRWVEMATVGNGDRPYTSTVRSAVEQRKNGGAEFLDLPTELDLASYCQPPPSAEYNCTSERASFCFAMARFSCAVKRTVSVVNTSRYAVAPRS